jgi:hypothetical protein
VRERVGRIALAALALGMAGCGSLGEPDAGLPIEDVETSGRMLPGSLAENPTGPHVELLTATVDGRELEIVMQRDGNGVCFALRRPPDSAQSCGPLPGAAGDFGEGFGMVMTGSGPVEEGDPPRPLELSGLLSAEVEAVLVEFDDGREARAVLFPLAPAQVEGSGFVVYLPAGAPDHSVVALAADGTELGRLGTMP